MMTTPELFLVMSYRYDVKIQRNKEKAKHWLKTPPLKSGTLSEPKRMYAINECTSKTRKPETCNRIRTNLLLISISLA